jgi:hypothetical protein
MQAADGSITINNLLATREENKFNKRVNMSNGLAPNAGNDVKRPQTAMDKMDKMPAPAQNRLASAASR